MTDGRIQALVAVLLAQLPEDGSNIGNVTLFDKFMAQAAAAGLTCTEDDFHDARERLLAAGQARKGKGRGGSTARVLSAGEHGPDPTTTALADDRPAFALESQVLPAELPLTAAPPPRQAATRRTAATTADPQVLSYRHPDRRVNNPEVGLVSEASDPERPKTVWAYDPHLDPVLNFDSARAKAEKLI